MTNKNSDCECLGACICFDDPSTAVFFKNKYCVNNKFKNCARYIVRTQVGPDKVPQDLLPHQVDRAKRIIKSAS